MEREEEAIAKRISSRGYSVIVGRDEWGDAVAAAFERRTGYKFVARGLTKRAALLELARQLDIGRGK